MQTNNKRQSLATQDNRDQNNQDEEETFKVYVRVRPLNQKEFNSNDKRQNVNIIKIQDNLVHIFDEEQQYDYSGKRDKMYSFDNAFSEQFSNVDIYQNTIEPLIPNILEGFNVTCFAYGMTGAGKTHTMIGNLNDYNSNDFQSVQEQGLSMQAINGVFMGMQERQQQYQYEMKVSYLEIYNEQVRDLLSDKSANLMIVEDPVKGVIVPDLNEFNVNSSNELASLIYMGNQRRTMAPTLANAVSSRSHAILIFSVEGRDRNRNTKEGVFYSKLQIIDLAGSERAAATDNRGQRMVEGANINRSLLALGNCINILSDKGKAGSFVPYRDSKLTRLLKDSLGGNTKTIMIACISPSYLAFEETVNTLKYASRARNIKRKLTKNVKEVEMHVSRYKEVIDSLRTEIESLRGQLRTQKYSRQSVSPIRSPLQQQQNPVPLSRSQLNSKQRDTSSNSKSRKSSYLRPNVTNVNKVAPQQNTHGHTTPVRLSNSYGKQPLITTRQLNYNQNVKDISLNQSQILSADQVLPNQNVGEIEDEIHKIYNEKLKLEQEILSDSKSNQDQQNKQTDLRIEQNEELYIQNLSQNLIANFEEHWELKQSIVDLEELQTKNKEQLNFLRNEAQELEQQNMNKFQSLNQLLESQIGKVITAKQNDIKILERNHQNNIKILNEMRIALDINLEQKEKLQSMLLQMHSSKRQTLLENQIEMRNLKLEKTDLYLENLQMKKITQIQQQEKVQTDLMLIEMQKQIQKMQQELIMKDQIIQESQKQLLQKQDSGSVKVSELVYNSKLNQSNHNSATLNFNSSHHKNKNLLFSCDNNDLSNPYDSHNSTVQIDFQSTLKEQLKMKNYNQGSAPNSSRCDGLSKSNNQQVEQINKKLVLSGFFEDDFQGELEKEEDKQKLKSNNLDDDLNGPGFEYGNQVSILQTKRQSQDVLSKVNPSNIKNQKGYTPNNRYNADNDNLEDLDQEAQSMRSSFQMDFNIDGSLERDQNQLNIFSNQTKETPVAQVNLFTQQSEKIQLYQPKIQTSNQRYQNHQPDPQAAINNQNANSTQSTSKYDSRRDNKSNNKKSTAKRSSKLNRYLSFNRKDTEDKQVLEKPKDDSRLKAVPFSNNSKDYLRENAFLENEKENSYPINNGYNQHIDIYNTISCEARNNQSKALSPPQNTNNHTIDLRQIQNNQDLHIPSNKFEQRKYSQPIVSSNSQNKQQIHKTPQNTGSRRPPSPGIHNTSTISGTSTGIQSYAQIRRQSKERQQLQQQSVNNSQIHQTPIQNNTVSNNPYSQRKSSIQNTTTDKRQSNGYNSHKIDLTNQNNSNRYKASATANISRYGPIKPTYSQNQFSSHNQTQQNANGMPLDITQGFGIGQTYFDNFIKKKNSIINFNGMQQQNTMSFNQSNANMNGPTRATNNFSGLMMNNTSNSNNGGPTAIKVFNNTQSPLIQSASHSNSNQNSYRQMQQQSNTAVQSTPQQTIPSTLQIAQLDSQQNLSIQNLKKNTKSNSINIQSLDELLIMNQTNSTANFTSVNPQSTTAKMNKDVDDLINKQKVQLTKDKEKLEKNHKIFTNSFASTINNPIQQSNQTDSSNISLNQQPLLHTERIYDTKKFASNSFALQTNNQINPNNGSLSGRTSITASNPLINVVQNLQTTTVNNQGYSTTQHQYQKQIHSQRYNQQSQQGSFPMSKTMSSNIVNHSSAQLNPCISGLSSSNSQTNILNIENNTNHSTQVQQQIIINNNLQKKQTLNNLNSQRNRYQDSSSNDDFMDDKGLESPAKRVYLLSESSENGLNLLPN